MYYNTNKSNSDYYNAYKEEMATLEAYENTFSFQKTLKLGFMILLLGLFSLLSIYIVNYFSTKHKEAKVETFVKKETLPKTIQLQEADSPNMAEIKTDKIDTKTEQVAEVTNRDIALIVEIIMSQMNHKEENSLEEQLISSEKHKKDRRTLKEKNHYNKVFVSTKKQNIVDRQVKLRKELDILLKTPNNMVSNYEIEIEKEINVRSNEMRIIIVQKGDTLSKIAKKAYGDIKAYKKIFSANPEVLKNPNEIFVGQKLRIPV